MDASGAGLYSGLCAGWSRCHSCTGAFRIHPLPQPRTHCIQRAAPGLPAAPRPGPAGRGGTGRGRPRCPGSQPPAAENEWVGASRWRTGFGPRASGCPQPPSVTRPTQLGTLPRLRSPPSSRGARRGRELGRKEPGKGGVGGRKAKAGGRRGRKRPPCGRAGPRGVAARVAGPCNLDRPPGAVLGGRVRPGPRGGPFPREALGSR